MLAGITLLLAACAHYEANPLNPEETQTGFDSRTLADSGLQAFIATNAPDLAKLWPRPAWDLAGLTCAALYYHPDLDVARAQYSVAQAAVTTAGGRPNPSFSLIPEYIANPGGGASPWAPGVALDIPIETGNKRNLRIAQADQLSEAAWLNIRTMAWTIRSDVRTALLDVAGSSRRTRLLQEQLTLQREIVRLLEQRVQVGEISSAESTKEMSNLARIQATLAEARRQEVKARASVATAVGIPLAALNGVQLIFDLETFPDIDRLTSSEVRRQALQSRADILAALAEYAASQSALQLEIANQYPDVHLGPGYQWDQGENKWQLGLSVEVPLLNRNQGPIAEAQARCAEAEARFKALQAKAMSGIDAAVSIFEASRENLIAAQSFADALGMQSETVAGQYDAGSIDRLYLLNTRFEAIESALMLLDAQRALHESLGALEDAIQWPIDDGTASFPVLTADGTDARPQETMKEQP